MSTLRHYMMATVARHMMGDISRDEPDLCEIDNEDSDNYIGTWVQGFGFMEVQFPKATTRELTADEKNRYHGHTIMMGRTPLGVIQIPDAPNATPIPCGRGWRNRSPLSISRRNSPQVIQPRVFSLSEPS